VVGARDDDHDDATSGQGRKASVLATTPGGTNVANTPYTHATPSPTVTRISGIGHHAWWHFDRATTVTISGTEQTGATAEGVTANIV
jgi:hypothetical protein